MQSGQGKPLPGYVTREFDDHLKCGRLEYGFLRVRCDTCHHEKLVAFSCKRRGFCPSCGARRMVDSAAHLVDEVAQEAFEMTAYEDFVTEQVKKGVSIIGLYPCTKEEHQQAFEIWRKENNR